MPSVDTTLCYAVPVKVELLGPHLEAYVNLLPTISTLRLCHRYGQGQDVHLSKLPVELITYIEEILTAGERTKLRGEWAIDFECFQQHCEPIEHLAEEQLTALRKLAREGKIPEDATHCEDVEDRVMFHLLEDIDAWMDIHLNRAHSWEERGGMKSAARRGFFTKNSELISKHFGLDVWISHVRLPTDELEGYWEVSDFFPPETTVAYLKLPGARQEFKAWDLRPWERDDKDFFIESGYGMPVSLPKHDDADGGPKFKRMMRKLDLQPYVAGSQRDMALAVDDLGKGEAEEAISSWPRLTMLVRCVTRSDDED